MNGEMTGGEEYLEGGGSFQCIIGIEIIFSICDLINFFNIYNLKNNIVLFIFLNKFKPINHSLKAFENLVMISLTEAKQK